MLMRAVAELVACCWSGLELAGSFGLLESDAMLLLLLLLLLLISDEVLLSLGAGGRAGAGGGGHLSLVKKFENAARAEQLSVGGPQKHQSAGRELFYTTVRSCSSS